MDDMPNDTISLNLSNFLEKEIVYKMLSRIIRATSATIATMTIIKRLLRIVIIVESLLLLGFLPTLFNPNAHIYGGSGGGWDWSPWVFVGPMAGLLFVAGLLIDISARNIKNPPLRIIFIATILLLVAMIWGTIVRSE